MTLNGFTEKLQTGLPQTLAAARLLSPRQWDSVKFPVDIFPEMTEILQICGFFPIQILAVAK